MRPQTNLLSKKELEDHLNVKKLNVIYKSKITFDETNMKVLSFEEKVIKTNALLNAITDEWRVIKHLKDLKYDCPLISGAELLEVNNKKCIMMPKFKTFKEFMIDKTGNPGRVDESDSDSEEDKESVDEEVPNKSLSFNKYMKDLFMQIDALHNHGIIHCDIKDANIFYDEKRDKLILGDFGNSYIMTDGLSDEDRKKGLYDKSRKLNIAVSISPLCYRSPESEGECVYVNYHRCTNELKLLNNLLKITDDDYEEEVKGRIIAITHHLDTNLRKYRKIEFKPSLMKNNEYAFTEHKTIHAEVYSLAALFLTVFLPYCSENVKSLLTGLSDHDFIKRLTLEDKSILKVLD